MTISRRMIVLGASAAVAVPRGRAFADDYPSRPVKIIVPFGAGGPTDLYTRAMAEELRKNLHQSFVMENRPGAGSVIGTDVVAKSAPDGYTLLMISATQTVNETLIINKTYHLMRDFVMIAPLIKSDLVLVVHPSVPAKTVQELIALAKAKPGTLNYASSGIGSNYHMAGELFKHLTGTNIVHVPYKGSTGARTDILSGQVQMMFDSVPSMAPMIKGKLVRALATSGLKRSQVMPDVPTLDESGVRGYEASLWTGFVAPARTPEPIVKLLSTEINKVLARPDIRESWEMQGAIPMSMTPDQFTAFVQSEIVKWAGVIKANGIKPIN
ncbi:MAG TPA: tripartite tricarboxylate transporter substrate binding protein [Pseudolabrys sp.]|nr:tripartite tricarboxylate transporter substrate binding protein [Pseudolabrys sp.]